MRSRFLDHFSERAAEYAAHRPTYPTAVVDLLAALAPRRDLAWDAGCGSGQLSVLLGERFERVIATDASEEVLAHAVPHPKVEYRCASAEDSGLREGTVDLAVAAQAAHWFDVDAYFLEVRRLARRGALVALVGYGVMETDGEIAPVVRRFYSETLGPYWPPERRHPENGYRSIRFPFEEIDVPPLEIRALWRFADLIGYIDTWSAVRALEKIQGRGPIEAFHGGLRSAWGTTTEARNVRWPLSLRVGCVGGA